MAAKARGRPTKYTESLGKKIAALLAGGKTLKQVSKMEGMPAKSTLLVWAVDSNHDFSDRYARARRCRAEGLIDELTEISDDGTNDTYEDENGNQRTDQDVLGRSKLRVDTRKWIASKILAGVYGDSIKIDQTVDDKRAETRKRTEKEQRAFLKLQAEVMAEEAERRKKNGSTRQGVVLPNGKNGGANGRN